MIYAREQDGIRGYFAAVRQGRIVTGLLPAVFTATVTAPDTTTGLVVAVAETVAKPGLYTFLVPDTFLTANGSGVYAVVIEVDASGPTLRDVIVSSVRVGERNEDDIYRLAQAVLGVVV